jgi:hypothetical protein
MRRRYTVLAMLAPTAQGHWREWWRAAIVRRSCRNTRYPREEAASDGPEARSNRPQHPGQDGKPRFQLRFRCAACYRHPRVGGHATARRGARRDEHIPLIRPSEVPGRAELGTPCGDGRIRADAGMAPLREKLTGRGREPPAYEWKMTAALGDWGLGGLGDLTTIRVALMVLVSDHPCRELPAVVRVGQWLPFVGIRQIFPPVEARRNWPSGLRRSVSSVQALTGSGRCALPHMLVGHKDADEGRSQGARI